MWELMIYHKPYKEYTKLSAYIWAIYIQIMHRSPVSMSCCGQVPVDITHNFITMTS